MAEKAKPPKERVTPRAAAGKKSAYPNYTPNLPPKSIVVEFCCSKHSAIAYAEFKRLHRTKNLCDIHMRVHTNPLAAMERLNRLGFVLRPTGELEGMAYRLLPDEKAHGGRP